MVFENIEKLQREWTDKYVVVDGSRPELRRFEGETGVVKTVNFTGKALVQFDGYHANIGWYDIDTQWLKIVDAPLPKPEKEEKKKAEKPAAKKEAAPAPKPAAKPGGGASVADILAAARANKAAPSAAAEKPTAEKKPSTADILAAARSKPGAAAAPAAPAPVDAKKMSTADIIAAAKANKAAAAAKPAAPPAPAPTPEPVAEPAAETVVEEAPAVESGAPPKLDPKTMSVAQMIAYCKKTDAS